MSIVIAASADASANSVNNAFHSVNNAFHTGLTACKEGIDTLLEDLTARLEKYDNWFTDFSQTLMDNVDASRIASAKREQAIQIFSSFKEGLQNCADISDKWHGDLGEVVSSTLKSLEDFLDPQLSELTAATPQDSMFKQIKSFAADMLALIAHVLLLSKAAGYFQSKKLDDVYSQVVNQLQIVSDKVKTALSQECEVKEQRMNEALNELKGAEERLLEPREKFKAKVAEWSALVERVDEIKAEKDEISKKCHAHHAALPGLKKAADKAKESLCSAEKYMDKALLEPKRAGFFDKFFKIGNNTAVEDYKARLNESIDQNKRYLLLKQEYAKTCEESYEVQIIYAKAADGLDQATDEYEQAKEEYQKVKGEYEQVKKEYEQAKIASDEAQEEYTRIEEEYKSLKIMFEGVRESVQMSDRVIIADIRERESTKFIPA